MYTINGGLFMYLYISFSLHQEVSSIKHMQHRSNVNHNAPPKKGWHAIYIQHREGKHDQRHTRSPRSTHPRTNRPPKPNQIPAAARSHRSKAEAPPSRSPTHQRTTIDGRSSPQSREHVLTRFQHTQKAKYYYNILIIFSGCPLC
jgi:hypothetical protein